MGSRRKRELTAYLLVTCSGFQEVKKGAFRNLFFGSGKDDQLPDTLAEYEFTVRF